MSSKVHMKDSKQDEKKKNSSTKKSQATQLKKKEKDSEKKINSLNKWINKTNITYFILLLLDIILVIYSARKNIVNYVVVSEQEIFVSKTRYLLWGRNYINLLIIGFFYGYTCLVNKFFLHRKNTKKFMFWLFVILVLLNCLLFVLFTKKVY